METTVSVLRWNIVQIFDWESLFKNKKTIFPLLKVRKNLFSESVQNRYQIKKHILGAMVIVLYN